MLQGGHFDQVGHGYQQLDGAALTADSASPELRVHIRWTPHPVIVTIRDNRDYLRVLLYSYYITITGWGLLLRYISYDGRHESTI